MPCFLTLAAPISYSVHQGAPFVSSGLGAWGRRPTQGQEPSTTALSACCPTPQNHHHWALLERPGRKFQPSSNHQSTFKQLAIPSLACGAGWLCSLLCLWAPAACFVEIWARRWPITLWGRQPGAGHTCSPTVLSACLPVAAGGILRLLTGPGGLSIHVTLCPPLLALGGALLVSLGPASGASLSSGAGAGSCPSSLMPTPRGWHPPHQGCVKGALEALACGPGSEPLIRRWRLSHTRPLMWCDGIFQASFQKEKS